MQSIAGIAVECNIDTRICQPRMNGMSRDEIAVIEVTTPRVGPVAPLLLRGSISSICVHL